MTLFARVTPAILAGALCASSAAATQIHAWATRTVAVSKTTTNEVAVALTNNGATTLQFTTTKDDQLVKIVYNAECVVEGERGTTLRLRILVDALEAQPVGDEFVFCSAVNTIGGSWAPAVRQSVLKVPKGGTHKVQILAHLVRAGGGEASGTWRLDDSSLVVSGNILASAVRTTAKTGSSGLNALPLNDDDATTLTFHTNTANDRVALTYNAECVLTANAGGGQLFAVFPFVSGAQSSEKLYKVFCDGFDSAGKTWAGSARQIVVELGDAGDYEASVNAGPNVGSAPWRIDDASLVIERGVRAYAKHEDTFKGSATSDVQVPLFDDGSKELIFTTSAPNQVVKIVYSASCSISGDVGDWASIRVVVDGVQAQPASGSDFAFCSGRGGGLLNFNSGYRQSVMVVPNAGSHTVTIFQTGVGASYVGLSDRLLLVE